MEKQLSFDTAFLIDLQKERIAGERGPAHGFLERYAGAHMALSSVALGEFAEGFRNRNDPALQALAAAVDILRIDTETALLYGSNARRLRHQGALIGTNDLWIGCCSVRHGLPLVSRDSKHFGRIQNLEIVEY